MSYAGGAEMGVGDGLGTWAAQDQAHLHASSQLFFPRGGLVSHDI